MHTKKVVKPAKTTAKRSPPKKIPKSSPRVAALDPLEDPALEETVALHEHVEPRELSHQRLHNTPEETATPALDDDLVDDVAASANDHDSRTIEADDDAS